ncbi:hypothetical protein [Planctopirus hydrillae]|uniref:Uncharacterized protein n=1 Tax=Planctopirus hydrillae TaxID=1841610 RepID=A0A1C3E477_9PLAN|nr:hypothetical protein [Planctopirus hydrillae]ODA28046.1 hypothetical protein A6X21_14390 [Planctopirus hydrillae]
MADSIVRFDCPCGRKLKVKAGAASKAVKCPGCQISHTIERMTPEEMGSYSPVLAKRPSLWQRWTTKPALSASEQRKALEAKSSSSEAAFMFMGGMLCLGLLGVFAAVIMPQIRPEPSSETAVAQTTQLVPAQTTPSGQKIGSYIRGAGNGTERSDRKVTAPNSEKVSVSGYINSKGKYVAPYERSKPKRND